MTTHDFTRRRFLRGAGGAAVALPYLLGQEGDTRAAEVVPERLVTVFYGNGLPKELSQNGFQGVLAPLAPFAPKMTMVRGVNVNCRAFGNGHTHGSYSFACGMDGPSANTKSGPSLDWVAYKAFGASTPLSTLSAGIFGSDEPQEVGRTIHSWRGPGQPNDPFGEPLDLFNALWKGAPMPGKGVAPDEAVVRKARNHRLAIDAVLQDFKFATSAASGYSKKQRDVIATHAEHLFELEKRALELEKQVSGMGPATPSLCGAPGAPARLNVSASQRPETWAKAWPLMVDLYVLALRCDLFRFGNLTVVSGGGRYPFKGKSGQTDNAHSGVFHLYPAQYVPLALEVFTWSMTNVAYFLSRMDDPQHLEANGKTLLDNTTVFIGTELGDPAPHLNTDMTFMIAGARNRFKPGVVTMTGGRTDVELYNTLLKRIGIANVPFGDQRHYRGDLPLA